MRISSISLPFLAACAFALVALPFADTARAAPDKTQGMALMSATVFETGVLFSGSGAVESERLQEGAYRVRFNRTMTVEDCVFAAHAVFGGYAQIVELPDEDAINVLVFEGGDPVDTEFSLVVFCAR